jgi:dipeptidase D
MGVIEHFKALCKIPHCSHGAEAMKRYLQQRADAYGFSVSADSAGNILCRKKGAKITLQAHYDMVCIGTEFPIATQEKAGWLSAESSTLGADNGIGMAMMLALMEESAEIDALFTADEEVGLLGARGLEIALDTPYLLNLDSEEEGVVSIGCAGGVDIIAKAALETVEEELFCYEIEVSGLPGGHSGVDIDKKIPNAIKELASSVKHPDLRLISISGGERRNAIPKHAVAEVGFAEAVSSSGLRPLGKKRVRSLGMGEEVIDLLDRFEHGVREMDEELDIVKTSINLAQIETDEGMVTIHLSGRSMEKSALEALEKETVEYFEAAGFIVRSEGFYSPWQPEQNAFAKTVLELSKAVFPDARFGAIHAGLECGIIKEKAPDIAIASIGPNIENPHSAGEKVELASVERVFDTVKKIVASVQA